MSNIKNTYVFLGASSVITKAIAEIYAPQGHHIILCGRPSEETEITLNHLKIMGAGSVMFLPVDIKQTNSHQEFIESIIKLHSHNGLLHLFALSASMPSQDDINKDVCLGIDCIDIGFTGLFSVLHRFVPYFEKMQSGSITIFGSVAGDRGRLKNYVYGASKAGLECYASGLRNQLARSNVHVMLVKPGFMNTPMIKDMKLPPLPIAEPQDVAKIVTTALEKKRNVIYVPWFWQIIMGIIQHIPEFIFKKMSF